MLRAERERAHVAREGIVIDAVVEETRRGRKKAGRHIAADAPHETLCPRPGPLPEALGHANHGVPLARVLAGRSRGNGRWQRHSHAWSHSHPASAAAGGGAGGRWRGWGDALVASLALIGLPSEVGLGDECGAAAQVQVEAEERVLLELVQFPELVERSVGEPIAGPQGQAFARPQLEIDERREGVVVGLRPGISVTPPGARAPGEEPGLLGVFQVHAVRGPDRMRDEAPVSRGIEAAAFELVVHASTLGGEGQLRGEGSFDGAAPLAFKGAGSERVEGHGEPRIHRGLGVCGLGHGRQSNRNESEHQRR